MAADAELNPLYGQQAVVRNRTSTAMSYWAGYWATTDVPSSGADWDEEKNRPTKAWVQRRVFSDRVTRYPQNYLDASMNYYSQDSTIQQRMRDLMDGFPTQEERDDYASVMEGATAGVMSRMSASDVDDNAVRQWYDANGFAEQPAPQIPNPPSPPMP